MPILASGVPAISDNITQGHEGGNASLVSRNVVANAAAQGRIQPGHVVVLRYLGPVASSMPEVLVATAALSVPELKGKVALLSDTRISGISHGCIGIHCAPEAAIGGPIALIQGGDEIHFDLLRGHIHVEADLASRPLARPDFTPPVTRGYLADFVATVTQANRGCVSQWALAKSINPSPTEKVE